MYPEFVTGNDIVFPTDVAGIFLRNLGGNANPELTFQDDRTALPTNPITATGTTDTTGSHVHAFEYQQSAGISSQPVSAGTLGVRGTQNTLPAGDHNHNVTVTVDQTSGGGDVETNPINYAMQLYTVADGFPLIV
jgi:hypothetical protein